MKLVERDLPLNSLENLLRDVADGTGRVALVSGEAGIGKTSLVAQFVERAGDARIWWGACDALQTPHPLAPLQDIVREADPGFGPLLNAGADRSRLFEAVLSELRASTRATLFVVEDAHWADDATLDLLKFLARRLRNVSCLLVITYRDDEVDATHPLRQLTAQLPAPLGTRVELARLSPNAVAQLARSALRSPEGIHAITQGNPFFVAELLRNEAYDVPRGVQDLVLSRLSRLDPEAQQVIQLASLVPARVERWLIDALLSPSLATLEECLNSGLLNSTGADFAFRHELARVAVELSLSPPTSATLHARILDALERPDAPTSSLARRAHHAARAGERDAVLRLAPEAARQAQARGAHREAASHWRIALAHAGGIPQRERAAMLDALSYESYVTGRSEESLSTRVQAQALWSAAGDALREGDSLRWLSRLCWYNGRNGPAEAHAARAIELLETLPPGPELAMAYSNRSQLHMLVGQSDEAIVWGRKALALAERLAEADVEVHALNNVGAAMLNRGDPDGRALLERSLERALKHGFGEHAARAYTNLAFHVLAVRDFAAAWPLLERGIAYCEEQDLAAWGAYMSGYRAEALLATGDWTGASTQAEAVLQLASVPPISRVLPLVVLAHVRARRGEPAACAGLLDEALSLALPMCSLMRVGPVAAARAETAWLQGDLATVASEAERTAALAMEGNYLRWTAGEIAYWQYRAGTLEAAPERCPEPYSLQFAGRWKEAAEAWQRIGCPYERARALADGDVAAQREALVVFERLGASIDAERVRKSLHAAGVRGLPRGQRASTQANPHALTAREMEILGLLCAGLRNAQIAERLHRSVRTVDHHVAAVFAKLGVATRAEAIATAHAAGLAPRAAPGK
ncbi:ATP-binding protein [Arenimonas sp.]|uniref:ATP-binding protein n=1 Tax=Arenimonas sp. TaxID=1872635 RepID=UPI0039E51E28